MSSKAKYLHEFVWLRYGMAKLKSIAAGAVPLFSGQGRLCADIALDTQFGFHESLFLQGVQNKRA